MTEPPRIVRCPRCGKANRWEEHPGGPFCSERCRIIDLGKWAEEDYSIPVVESNGEPQEATLGEN